MHTSSSADLALYRPAAARHGRGPGRQPPEGDADGYEWKTPPLGIGPTEAVSGHTEFLHDGRARNLTEAILARRRGAEIARCVRKHAEISAMI